MKTIKEKINRFFVRGWHFLAFAWMNTAIMGYSVIGSLLEGLWLQAFACFLFYLPWIIVFIEMYRNHKLQIRNDVLIGILNEMEKGLIPVFKRYRKLYGEPPEEKIVDKESEDQANPLQEQ